VPTNKKLFAKEQSLAAVSLEDKSVEVGISKAETTNALLDKWATLNFARALLLAVGSLCTAWAAVSKREVVGYSEMALGTGANRMG
jgi:DMSO reductase anchor subunit